jgi:AraC family transcriptional regulator
MVGEAHPVLETPGDRGLVMPGRVSVLVGTRSVPLISSKPVMDSVRSPWTGLIVEKHSLGAVAIPEHEHPTFCLHLQTSDYVEMDWHSAGSSGHTRSGVGNLILLAQGTRDSLLWYGPSQRVVVSIDPLILGQASEQLGFKTLGDFDNRWSFQDEQLRLLLTEMEREMSSGWAMGPLYGDLLGMSLSIALVKKYAHAPSLPPPIRGGLSRTNLRNILAYIEEHLEQDIRLEKLAMLAGLSVFHFARSFRESLGHTPHQYIVQMKVKRAKTLLMRPEWSVQQVASAVGIPNASQFAKIFRGATGVSPAAWRRMI